MIKDLFNEIVRRMEWAKDRKLEPQISRKASEYLCRIPIDESLIYTVSIRSQKVPGVLIQSYFPDGEPHYYEKLDRLEREEAITLLNAASLIVYGRLIPLVEETRPVQSRTVARVPLRH